MVLEKLNSYIQKKKLDYLLTAYTRINSKCFKDLNVRLETIKILEKNIGNKTLIFLLAIFYSGMSPQGREIREKNKLMGLQQTKTAKKTINKMKRQPIEWENIFANDTSDKE